MSDFENGLPQTLLHATLHHVPVSFDKRSALWQTPGDRLSPAKWEIISKKLGYSAMHRMPLHISGRTSFERLCRLRLTSQFMMPNDVETLFQNSPVHKLIAKIQNSIWRTSYRRAGWNEIVDAWNGLKAFSIGIDSLSVTIDHTRGCNPSGYGEYIYTYLDGCLAFHIHHQSQRVMTIGFSLASGRRLLLEQVQLASPTGNRWLYKLPCGRLEFVISRLRHAFPKHRFYLVSGQDIATRSLNNYKTSLNDIDTQLQTRTTITDDHRQRLLARQEDLIRRISHLESDMPRISDFYADTGSYTLHTSKTIAAMTHRAIL